ncbi:MAG: anhydro-N-acetylmuramic acid kinase [Rhodothermales bacterium]|nr:anhydro-N-acetylmuramic acid kinase [Rhodothermales bacterium]
MNRWRRLFEAGSPRVVAGVMSGTSLDGIDVAIAALNGSGRDLTLQLVGTRTTEFPGPVAAELSRMAEADAYPVDSLTLLNARLSAVYDNAIRDAARSAGIPISEIHLVGCHGQTVRHQPHPQDFAGGATSGTLQLGNGAALAATLGIPVVSDFRSADVALGGQGAPLVPYFDYVTLRSDHENRIALNLGGIANLTALPAGVKLGGLLAFDTGPANMAMNGLAERLLGEPYDRDGKHAAAGRPIRSIVESVLARPYFAASPPKSAGRKSAGAGFGSEFVEWMIAQAPAAKPSDLLATAAAITVESIVLAVARFVPFDPDVLVVSGGGCRNTYLMECLRGHFARVETSDEFGVDATFKEALAFAVLAHEAVNGVATGIPAVTGASRPAVLGSISWP